ncbi:MAG TPA: cytochrome c [Alphaproteobacteria bacterium]|nr:cytochrome c [Alphaproteobacteria bacterium]
MPPVRTALTVVAVAGLAVATLSAANAQTPPAAGDAAAGRRVALNQCYACHVVAADQPYSPTLHQPAASFVTIANRPATSPDSLREFLTTTHAGLESLRGMPNPRLTDDQTADVIAYVLSLRRRP